MEILKRLVLFAVVMFSILFVFVAGVWSGALSIQKSCDNPNEAKTIINGRAYLCGDWEMMQRAIAQLQHQRGA